MIMSRGGGCRVVGVLGWKIGGSEHWVGEKSEIWYGKLFRKLNRW